MATDGKTQGRLLWNDHRTVVLFVLAVLVTVGIIAFQLGLRRGEFDPTVLRIYYRLYLFHDYPAAILMVGILILGLVPTVQSVAIRLAQFLGDRPAVAAGLSFCFLMVMSRLAYLAHPLAMDESVPVMQSAVFASGGIVGRFPPELIDWLIMPGFQGHFIKVSPVTGEFVSSYWPGFALLLTPFIFLGIPWACNPTIGALGIYVIHALALRVSGSNLGAGLAVLWTIGSAAFVINSISFYSMTAHLVCNAVFVLLLLEPTPRRALAAGMVGGLALTLHNPLPHMLFALPWLVWAAARADRVRILPALIAGYLPWVIVVGLGWYMLQLSLSDGTGSHAVPGRGLAGSVIELLGNIFRLPNSAVLQARFTDLTKLWIWSAPALPLLAALGLWVRRRDSRFLLLAASAALTLVGFLIVPVDQGHGWGHRYFHSAWFVLPLLATGVIRAGSASAEPPSAHGVGSFARFGAAGALASAFVVVPYFLVQVHGFISEHLSQLPTATSGTPKIIIINPYGGYYSQDLVQNDPFLREPVVRMVTRGRAEDARMMAQHYPDLVLLKSGYRGTVWGYADGDAERQSSARAGALTDHQGEQE